MAELIIIVIIVALCVIAVVMYVKKLRHGCCGTASDTEQAVRPDDEDISAYPYKYVIVIGGMTCPKCAQRIQNAFNKQDGCYAVVSHKSNMAIVHTKQNMPQLLLRKTIIDIGYSVENITAEG